MRVRGRWLRYLGRGLVALGVLALPLPAALFLAGLGMAVGIMVLITATVTRIEGCFLPESREFSRRMFRMAMRLFLGGIALVVIAGMTEPFRLLVAPAIYHPGFWVVH